MSDQVEGFGKAAIGLARNPLGIIALFIVLVYGFACLLTAFAANWSGIERMLLVCFLTGFPVLVLACFIWLVIGHSGKLFAPSDFRNEDNYLRLQNVKLQLSAAASLAVATTKGEEGLPEKDINRIVAMVQDAASTRQVAADSWRNRILWVDDRPGNNVHERRAFEAFGLEFTLALSTAEALEELSKQRFAGIISDMGRREGPREGYQLLDTIRRQGNNTPLFFYASSNAPEHKRETEEHGGQGSTNNAQELFQMVTRAVIAGRSN